MSRIHVVNVLENIHTNINTPYKVRVTLIVGDHVSELGDVPEGTTLISVFIDDGLNRPLNFLIMDIEWHDPDLTTRISQAVNENLRNRKRIEL